MVTFGKVAKNRIKKLLGAGYGGLGWDRIPTASDSDRLGGRRV